MKKPCLLLSLLLAEPLAGPRPVAAETPPLQASVQATRSFTDSRTGITVVAGELELPSRALWVLATSGAEAGPLREVFVDAPALVWTAVEGERLGDINERRSLEKGRMDLSRLSWACRQYASDHDGIGPATLADLDPKHFAQSTNEQFRATYVLAPKVPLPERNWEVPENGVELLPLAFEVRPEIDDGKHWVAWNNGRVLREEIDPERVAKYDLKIVPRGLSREQQLSRLGETARYRLLARRQGDGNGPVSIELRDQLSGQRVQVEWMLDSLQPGDQALLRDWGRLRVGVWQRINDVCPTLALSVWLQQARGLYLAGESDDSGEGRRRPGNETTLFGVLGGRAAIRETLQLQDIAGSAESDTGGTNVPLSAITGVSVKAHDYDAMLNGQPGGRLPLVEVVPHDRFLACFPQPSALVQFLDSGTDFLFHLSSGFTGSSLRYDLLDRYLARLGMTREFMRSLLESEALAEVALFMPDLHFIDGTDVTVVARMRDMDRVALMLRLVGMGDLSQVVARTTATGHEVFWAKRGDLLLISSRRSELESALGLAAADGRGSLGRSAEFRYMLTQLPVRDITRGYLYFSDPFLRRLTGPEVKIGQFRRVVVRGQLEAASAGALLYQRDHGRPATDYETLVQQGYAPDVWRRYGGIRLEPDGRTVSTTYGPAAGLATLLDQPLDSATAAEAKAYNDYRQNYERFWRQFFDPIAIRLDQTADDRMELETFILPLIDSSFYSGFRGFVATAESGQPLRVPRLDPEPVAMLSVNLTDKAWLEWLDNMDDLLVQAVGIHTSVLDHLGPSLHVALADTDPIINTGSGDLLASFAGGGRRFNDEMFILPMMISMLTRPTSLLVELKDPAAVRAELLRLPTGDLPRRGGFLPFQNSLYRIAGRDEWIFTLSIEGMLKLRYGLSLQDRYLVISNLPLTQAPRVHEGGSAPNNGLGLALAPRAAEQLLPALFTAAKEQERHAAMEGLAMLYPVLDAAGDDLPAVTERHARLFGFAPVHPNGGEFQVVDQRLQSTEFGRFGAEQQPAFEMGDRDFGVLRRVQSLDLSVQFEQDGLRARCSWEFTPRTGTTRN
ncbi:MAG: hypothetical protein H7A46_24195 [Verrucomicrobiales bacterium]|nr:hypothetical protein [Verrucomicrobiales bacterium]